MTDQQLIHKANGVKRIKQAIANCDLPDTSKGTIYSIKYTKLYKKLRSAMIEYYKEYKLQ